MGFWVVEDVFIAGGVNYVEWCVRFPFAQT